MLGSLNFKQKQRLYEAVQTLYKKDFYSFLKDVFEEVKGFPFKPNWSVENLCEHLTLLAKGHIERLITSLPRGYGKSVIESEFYPAWLLLRDPSERITVFSRAITEDAKGWHQNTVKTFDSSLVKDYFPDFTTGEKNKMIVRTNKGGYRRVGSCLASSVGSDLTFAIIDDPTDHEHARSRAKQDRIKNFLTKSLLRAIRTVNLDFGTEFVSQLTESDKLEYELTKKLESEVQAPSKPPRLLFTMQRLNAKDPVSLMLQNRDIMLREGLMTDKQYVYLAIPAEAKEGKTYLFPKSGKMYSTKLGEYLEAGTLSKREIEKAKADMLDEDYEAQMNQNPQASSGSIFKEEWITYEEDIDGIKFDSIYASIDCASETGVYNDFSAILVIGVKTNFINGKIRVSKIYLLDVKRVKLEFDELYNEILRVDEDLTIRGARLDGTIIEKASAGIAILQSLKHHNYSKAIPFKPKGSKEARFKSAIQKIKDLLKSKSFILPQRASWKVDFINELIRFPDVLHDDQIDALSQFINFYFEEKDMSNQDYINSAFDEEFANDL